MCLFKKKKSSFLKNPIPYSREMELENIIIDFKNEHEWDFDIAYNICGNDVKLYTTRPGILIGPHGVCIQKLEERLKAFHYDNIEVYGLVGVVHKKWSKSDIDKADEELMQSSFIFL